MDLEKLRPEYAAEHEQLTRELFGLPYNWTTRATSRFAKKLPGLYKAEQTAKKRSGKPRCCSSHDLVV